jgi:hypothetical protein
MNHQRLNSNEFLRLFVQLRDLMLVVQPDLSIALNRVEQTTGSQALITLFRTAYLTISEIE